MPCGSLVSCIEHAPEGLDSVVAAFGRVLVGKHSAVIRDGPEVLRRRFANDAATEGYRKDGPVSVAKFEHGEGLDVELREVRVLRQRRASDLIDRLLAGIGYPAMSSDCPSMRQAPTAALSELLASPPGMACGTSTITRRWATAGSLGELAGCQHSMVTGPWCARSFTMNATREGR